MLRDMVERNSTKEAMINKGDDKQRQVWASATLTAACTSEALADGEGFWGNGAFPTDI